MSIERQFWGKMTPAKWLKVNAKQFLTDDGPHPSCDVTKLNCWSFFASKEEGLGICGYSELGQCSGIVEKIKIEGLKNYSATLYVKSSNGWYECQRKLSMSDMIEAIEILHDSQPNGIALLHDRNIMDEILPEELELEIPGLYPDE